MKQNCQYYCLPVVLSCVCAFCMLDIFSFAFNIDRFWAGEWWLVVGSQWSHINSSHYLLNLLGLWAQWFGFRYWFKQRVLVVGLVFGMIGVGAWLVFAKINFYMGLSGALHGSLMAATLVLFSIKKPFARVFATILLCLLLFKAFGEYLIFWSQQGGQAVQDAMFQMPLINELLRMSKFFFQQANFQVAYPSHWVGLLGGMFAFGVLFFKGSVRANATS